MAGRAIQHQGLSNQAYSRRYGMVPYCTVQGGSFAWVLCTKKHKTLFLTHPGCLQWTWLWCPGLRDLAIFDIYNKMHAVTHLYIEISKTCWKQFEGPLITTLYRLYTCYHTSIYILKSESNFEQTTSKCNTSACELCSCHTWSLLHLGIYGSQTVHTPEYSCKESGSFRKKGMSSKDLQSMGFSHKSQNMFTASYGGGVNHIRLFTYHILY